MVIYQSETYETNWAAVSGSDQPDSLVCQRCNLMVVLVAYNDMQVSLKQKEKKKEKEQQSAWNVSLGALYQAKPN